MAKFKVIPWCIYTTVTHKRQHDADYVSKLLEVISISVHT